MVYYPAAYVLLTLPIALGRMLSMTGRKLPDAFFVAGGTLLTSCGWVDALLYTLTRRILVSNQLSTGRHTYSNNVTTPTTNAARPGDERHYGLQSMNKDVDAARTVTIIGASNRRSRLAIDSRGRNHARARSLTRTRTEESPSGSTDSIIKPGPNAIGIVAETAIKVETTDRRESQSESGFSTNSTEPAEKPSVL